MRSDRSLRRRALVPFRPERRAKGPLSRWPETLLSRGNTVRADGWPATSDRRLRRRRLLDGAGQHPARRLCAETYGLGPPRAHEEELALTELRDFRMGARCWSDAR